MASHFFWFMATLYVVVSIGIEVCIRTTRARNWWEAEQVTYLVSGQRKDTWVACAVVWIVLLSNGFQNVWLLHATGAATLAWLLRRTAQRLPAVRRAVK